MVIKKVPAGVYISMDSLSFRSWAHHRQGLDELMPQADKVVPLVAQAGPRGMTRAEVGGVIDLDRDALDALLAGLVRFGLLSVTWENGIQVFRAWQATR
jgi:hypothetical protein